MSKWHKNHPAVGLFFIPANDGSPIILRDNEIRMRKHPQSCLACAPLMLAPRRPPSRVAGATDSAGAKDAYFS